MIKSAFYGIDWLSGELNRLVSAHPFMEQDIIGKSVMGKPIYRLHIGNGPFRWHFNAACHANEWMTSVLLMRFVEEFVRACHDGGTIRGKIARDLFEQASLTVVPMVNPDGVELVQTGLSTAHPYYAELLRMNNGLTCFEEWKANIRGVDLNDQFPAFWEDERNRRGVCKPGPRDYTGEAPLTEPEAQALVRLIECEDTHAVLSLHMQGEEIYWNYRGEEPPESADWANRLAGMAGYRAVYLEESDAGFKDWFIHRYRRPGFTVEAGRGTNPLQISQAAVIYEPLAHLLSEALDLSGGAY